MAKYFITSDVHGFYDKLIGALLQNGWDINNNDHRLIICGDVFDRGNQNKELLNFLRGLPNDRLIYIRGNHEDLLKECVGKIIANKPLEEYHFKNGTVKTIAQLCGVSEYPLLVHNRNTDIINTVKNTMQDVLLWIDSKAVDYKVIGDYIFVHGWMPMIYDGVNYRGKIINPRVAPFEMWNNHSSILWEEARWYNGMEMWNMGATIPCKTIVCGHYHSSWGHSHLHMDRKEFPQKNQKNWQKSFEPFIDNGIIAIDACTAYSGRVNVIVLET